MTDELIFAEDEPGIWLALYKPYPAMDILKRAENEEPTLATNITELMEVLQQRYGDRLIESGETRIMSKNRLTTALVIEVEVDDD